MHAVTHFTVGISADVKGHQQYMTMLSCHVVHHAGDCAIASSFVSYLGPFNKEFRELLITRDFYGGCVKLNIPVTKDMQVTKFLVDDSEVGEWTLQVLFCLILLLQTSA